MGFTAGDVIMLLVVLAVFLIFRQLDRGHTDSTRGPIDEHEITRTDFTDDLQGMIGGEEITTDVCALRQGDIVRGLKDGSSINPYDLSQCARIHLRDDAVAIV